MSRYTDFPGPDGLRVRGTVLVVPGRGETHATYARLGRRLATDAYRVRVVDAPRIDATDLAGSLERFAGELTAAVSHPQLPRPLVLAGADTGAVTIAALGARRDAGAAWWPDAVVLAGLPGYAAGAAKSWDEELDARTSCPVHRGVLTGDTSVERGSLAVAVPEALLDAAYAGAAEIPHLVLAGDADPLADRETLTRAVKALPSARLAIVHGAHHDVLNDLQHRSVAAEIVTFLETLKNGLLPVVSIESSAW
ncbi:alpha/beta hydrolase [Amycolatopsis sp. GM8]|uniref:alpha/beta hydrolase n=1 Tax=Amycolatopsis sp. GM8 TaxID=2896530 RepID=UPI001F34B180|nr:alpha/beta hydrolase [Amycolatopsis sp. GM8]